MSLKSFKELWSRDCKRISVISIGTKFNVKTIPKNRSSVTERSASKLETRRITRMSKSDD
jgi:hypothetical protein